VRSNNVRCFKTYLLLEQLGAPGLAHKLSKVVYNVARRILNTRQCRVSDAADDLVADDLVQDVDHDDVLLSGYLFVFCGIQKEISQRNNAEQHLEHNVDAVVGFDVVEANDAWQILGRVECTAPYFGIVHVFDLIFGIGGIQIKLGVQQVL
jgi:hypothetical protein